MVIKFILETNQIMFSIYVTLNLYSLKKQSLFIADHLAFCKLLYYQCGSRLKESNILHRIKLTDIVKKCIYKIKDGLCEELKVSLPLIPIPTAVWCTSLLHSKPLLFIYPVNERQFIEFSICFIQDKVSKSPNLWEEQTEILMLLIYYSSF